VADETRTILIDIEAPDKDFDEELGKVNSTIIENRKQIKELSKDYKNNATEIAKLEAENRDLSQSKRTLIKESKTEKGSLAALRLELAKQTKERNELNTSSEEGAARFKQLQTSIAGLNEEIGGFEQEGGDFRRNVGNYPSLAGNATGAIKQLWTTLLANPLIAIAALLAGLVKLFSESQTGAEFFRKSSAALNATLGLLKDIVEFLGGELIKLFENPKQALKDFAQLIKDNIVTRFEGLMKLIPRLGKAMGLLFKLKFAEAGKVALDAVAQVTLGVEDFTEKVGDSIVAVVEFGKKIKETSDEAFALEQRMIANEKALADFRVEQAKSNAEQKALNRIIEDQTKSFEERLAAGQAFSDAEEAQIAKGIELQEKRLKILREQNAQTNSTEEDLQRVRDAEIELANLLAASDEKQVTNANKLFGIRTQQEAARQKQVDQEFTDIQKLADEAAKASEEQDKRTLAELQLKQDVNQKIQSSATELIGTLAGDSKGVSLALAGINIAEAVTKSLTSVPFPFNIPLAAGTAAAGLVQLNKIKSTKVPGGGGGTASVSIPSGGGITPSGLANVNGSLLSQFSSPAQNQADQNAAIVQGISNMPQATVAVVDINTGQNKRAVKVGEAELG